MVNENYDLKKAALWYREKLAVNVIPLKGKVPMVNWKAFEKVRQTDAVIDEMDWQRATGVGIISGVGDICVIDFDKVQDDDAIGSFLEDLGLSHEYGGIVFSGSGKGYHIWFYLKGDRKVLYDLYGKESSVINLRPQVNGKGAPYEHLEVRIKDSQTAAPPSMHESGNRYIFTNKNSCKDLVDLGVEVVAKVIKKHCILPDSSAPQLQAKRKGVDKKQVKLEPYQEKKLNDTIEFLSKELGKGSYELWMKIGMGLASLGEIGRKYFIQLSMSNPYYKDNEVEINRKFDGFLRDYDGRITLGTIFHIAKEKGMEEELIVFWRADQNGSIQLNRTRFIRFLNAHGFFRWYAAKEAIFIRLVGNMVEEVNKEKIQDFVLAFIRNMEESALTAGITRERLEEAMLRSINVYFADNLLKSIPAIELEFKKDKEGVMNFYYSNCFVEVREAGIQVRPYTELGGVIWKDMIMPRQFKIGSPDGDWKKFVVNICDGDPNRIEAFMSMYGYVLHHYRKPSQTKAVILIDEKLSSGSAGGTGKSIIGNSFKYFRKWQFEDGKNFDFKKSFSFQKIEIGDQVLFFNDVAKNFDFERLFNLITDDWTVEKKNKHPISIPKEDAPKIVLSTNHMLKGSDASHLRRQYIFALTDHYGPARQPIHDFGKEFFSSEWEDADWGSFDNFTMECAQYYLRNGLFNGEVETVIMKRLSADTDADFAEFILDYEFTGPIKKKELLSTFQEAYPGHDRMSLNSFSKWIERYAQLFGFEYDKNKKVGGGRVYELLKK